MNTAIVLERGQSELCLQLQEALAQTALLQLVIAGLRTAPMGVSFTDICRHAGRLMSLSMPHAAASQVLPTYRVLCTVHGCGDRGEVGLTFETASQIDIY